MQKAYLSAATALTVLLIVSSPALAGYRDGMSLYEYVGSGPVAGVDPDGRRIIVLSVARDAAYATCATQIVAENLEIPDRVKGLERMLESISDETYEAYKKAGNIKFNGKPFPGTKAQLIELLKRETGEIYTVTDAPCPSGESSTKPAGARASETDEFDEQGKRIVSLPNVRKLQEAYAKVKNKKECDVVLVGVHGTPTGTNEWWVTFPDFEYAKGYDPQDYMSLLTGRKKDYRPDAVRKLLRGPGRDVVVCGVNDPKNPNSVANLQMKGPWAGWITDKEQNVIGVEVMPWTYKIEMIELKQAATQPTSRPGGP